MEHTDSIRLNLDIPNSAVPAIPAEVTNMKQTKKKRRSILKVQPVSEREALKVSQIQKIFLNIFSWTYFLLMT